jgi:hypothetical protein
MTEGFGLKTKEAEDEEGTVISTLAGADGVCPKAKVGTSDKRIHTEGSLSWACYGYSRPRRREQANSTLQKTANPDRSTLNEDRRVYRKLLSDSTVIRA